MTEAGYRKEVVSEDKINARIGQLLHLDALSKEIPVVFHVEAIGEGTYRLDPFEKDVLFLFCGRRGDRIKALVWEGTGFLLLYKRWENGSLSWPRTPTEAAMLSKHEFRLLLQGLNPLSKRVNEAAPKTTF